jgi:hypothetical protein
MTKLEVIAKLYSVRSVKMNEQDAVDRKAFEPIITKCPKVGSEALRVWTSKYFVSFVSKALIDKFEQEPTWSNFTLAANYLMIDRIIAAIALDHTCPQVQECVDLTLNCDNIDETTLMWIHFYTSQRTVLAA